MGLAPSRWGSGDPRQRPGPGTPPSPPHLCSPKSASHPSPQRKRRRGPAANPLRSAGEVFWGPPFLGTAAHPSQIPELKGRLRQSPDPGHQPQAPPHSRIRAGGLHPALRPSPAREPSARAAPYLPEKIHGEPDLGDLGDRRSPLAPRFPTLPGSTPAPGVPA